MEILPNPKANSTSSHEKLQLAVFLTVLVLVGIIVTLMWLPYSTLLAMAVILAVLFWPVYRKLQIAFKNGPLAAITSILIILLIVMAPLFLIGQLLFNELIGLYNQLRQGSAHINRSELVASLPENLQGLARNFLSDLGARFSQLAASAFQGATKIVSNVAGFLLSFFLVFFTVYYLLRDGQNVMKYLSTVFPLSAKHGNILVEKLSSAVSGVVKGSFLIALIQGTVSTIGYLIFGVPNPFLWGAFTVITALVPTVGTSIAIVPAVVYLLITGHTGAGIGMAVWGVIAVGLIDNFLSPKLIGSQTKLHPLMVLFGVLGGIKLFGYVGFLLGPIIMAIFVTLLDIYRDDLKGFLERKN